MTVNQPMTSAEFNARYVVVKPLVDGTVRTATAQAVDGGVLVMLHSLVGSAEENEEVLNQIEHLPPLDRKKVVEVVEVEGGTVVVTQPLPGFESFGAWLAGHVPHHRSIKIKLKDQSTRSATPRSAAKPELAPEVKREPGEFTRLFGAASTPASQESPPASGPGEFTRLFQPSPAAPMDSPASPPLSPSSPPHPMPSFPPASPREGSESATGVLNAPSRPAPVEPPVNPPVPPSKPPVLPLGAVSPVIPIPSIPPVSFPAMPQVHLPSPSTPTPPSTTPPGGLPASTPLAPPAPQPPMMVIPSLPPPIMANPVAPAPPPHVPSEFTRLIGSAAAPSPAPAPPASNPTTAGEVRPAGKTSYLPLIIALNVIVLAAIGLIVYFIVTR